MVKGEALLFLAGHFFSSLVEKFFTNSHLFTKEKSNKKEKYSISNKSIKDLKQISRSQTSASGNRLILLSFSTGGEGGQATEYFSPFGVHIY